MKYFVIEINLLSLLLILLTNLHQSWVSGGTADELPRERAKATFKSELLTNVLDGGMKMRVFACGHSYMCI